MKSMLTYIEERSMHEKVEQRFVRVQANTQIHLAQRMQAHETAILNKLILQYRSGTLTHESLYGGIATISELRSIVAAAEKDLMMAQEDAKNLANL